MTTPPFYAAWIAALQATLSWGDECAPRGKKVLEVVAPTLRFDGRRSLLVHPGRDLNYRFAVAEFLWMAAGSDLVEPLARYNSVMRRFSDDGVTLSGAYGPRLKPQWPRVLDTLRTDPDSRQAVAVIWRPDDASFRQHGYEEQARVSRDVPCTVSAQFLARGGKLHGVWTMRSNDLWLGLPYDAFTFARLTACVAGELRLGVGEIVVTAGSSHLYEEHWDAARACVRDFHLGRSAELPDLPGFPPDWVWESRRGDTVVSDGGPWAPYAVALTSPNKAEALRALEGGA